MRTIYRGRQCVHCFVSDLLFSCQIDYFYIDTHECTNGKMVNVKNVTSKHYFMVLMKANT